MRIEPANSGFIRLLNVPHVTRGSSQAAEALKSLGEAPPIILSVKEIGSLAALFAPGGLVSKLKRRLNHLKRKNCQVTPAKGTIACVDGNDLIYLGVEFLQEFQEFEDIIAGVMAHEWGHTCAAHRPGGSEIQHLNWDEIFELRRAHETLADEISGRLLSLMGYQPDNLIWFLLRGKKTHNLKYHDPETRAQIILHGFHDEERKAGLANQIFPRSVYTNLYHSRFVDEV